MASATAIEKAAPAQIVRQLNEQYEKVARSSKLCVFNQYKYKQSHPALQAHKAFEDNFWATKMNLKVQDWYMLCKEDLSSAPAGDLELYCLS